MFWRPTGFYWRRGIRESGSDWLKLRQIALALVTELEEHKALIRDLGWIPPKSSVHPDEIREKGWDLGEMQDGGHSIRVEVGPDGRERTVIEESH